MKAIHNDVLFNVGDTVRVHYRIIEREKKAGKTKRSVTEEIKERVQPYEGVVIGIKGSRENKTFTVRRLGINQVAIERVFPLISPWIEKVEVKSQGKVRRAKLYYLRDHINMNIKKRDIDVPKKKKIAKKQETKPEEKKVVSKNTTKTTNGSTKKAKATTKKNASKKTK